MEVGAIPTEVETKTSSEDLKCPLCEKPPFWAPAELLKHLTSGHFAKQMADVYKFEAQQPCHLCIKEGRDKPYKMTRFQTLQSLHFVCLFVCPSHFNLSLSLLCPKLLSHSMRSNYLTHVGSSHARVLEMLDEEPKRQLVRVFITTSIIISPITIMIIPSRGLQC